MDTISPTLTKIYNNTIQTSTYPQNWKSAFIIPHNKVLKPITPNDTRPTSNLSHIAKVFGSIIQLSNYLETQKLINPYQSGCRSGYSTQSALIYLLQDVRNGIDKGEVTILVLIDISKAFDSVDHFTLLKSLKDCNLSNAALKLIFAYLSNRFQAVLDNECNPTPLQVPPLQAFF